MKKNLSIILALLVILSLNVYLRLGTAFLPIAEEWAKVMVGNDIRTQAKGFTDKKFSDLPSESKEKITKDLFDSFEVKKEKEVKEQIIKRRDLIKSNWQDDSGNTFLLEIDCYHWLRLTDNLIRTGRIGDVLTGKQEYDSFMLAPIGMKVEASLHRNFQVYLTAFLFKAIKVFYKNIKLLNLAFYMPLVISCLVLLAVFFFSMTVSRGNIAAAFFSSLTLGLSTVFLNRTLSGWFDTDGFVILFSLLCAWLYYLALSFDIPLKKRALFSCCAGFFVGLFSFTWGGWWYIYDLLIITSLVYMANYILGKGKAVDGKSLKQPLTAFFLFVISSIFFTLVFSGRDVLAKCVLGPREIAFAKSYLYGRFWPNVFLTVDELRIAGLREVLLSVSSGWIICLALIYSIIAFFDKKIKNFQENKFLIFLFTFWIVIFLFISFKARRFTLLVTLPVSVFFGLFCGWAAESLAGVLKRLTKFRFVRPVVLALFLLVFGLTLMPRAFMSRKTTPLLNRDWWIVLNKIKTITPADAVINSWWDYGHWFKAIAGRRVIFDGATQNSPVAYWMGRALLAEDEKETAGILRMLNSGSNRAFEELEKYGFNKYKCLAILNRIIMLNYKEARAALLNYIPSDEKCSEILKYTHMPRPAYLVLDESMPRKMQMISLLAGWDFQRAEIYETFAKFPKQKFIDYLISYHGYDKQGAESLLEELALLGKKDVINWISPEPERLFFSESRFFRKDGNLLFFDNNFVLDLADMRGYFKSDPSGDWRIPEKIFYSDGLSIKFVKNDKADLKVSVFLIKSKQDNYSVVCLSHRIANSVFARAFFWGGIGLKNFQPVNVLADQKNNQKRVLVYKINWQD